MGLLLFLAIGFAPDAVAMGNGSWSVVPYGEAGASGTVRPYFEYELDPGAALEDRVVVTNLTDDVLTFEVFAADAQATPEGAFAVTDREDTQTGVGLWTIPETDRVTVEGGESVSLPFSVTIPDDAEPGDHAGGLVVRNVAPDGAIREGGVQLQIQRAVGARMYVRVRGEVSPNVEIHAVDVDRPQPVLGRASAALTYRVTNTGNVRLTPVVKVEARDMFGRRVMNFPADELPELLPGQTVEGSQPWAGMPWAGRFDLEFKVVAGPAEDSVGSSVWNVPLALSVIPLLPVGAFVGRKRWRRRASG